LLDVEVNVTLEGIEEFRHLHGDHRHKFKRRHEVRAVVRVVAFDLFIVSDIFKDLAVLKLEEEIFPEQLLLAAIDEILHLVEINDAS
jgi:hypothetical protein